MRIGIDARFWSESGVGRYIRNLVRELQIIDKNNEYVLFVNSKTYHQLTSEKNNWKLIPTDIHWHSFEEQIKFPQVLNQENLDLMHFPYFTVPIFYNKPFIVTIHDLILHHFATGEATTQPRIMYELKLLSYKFIIKKAARNARKIITVSNATKQEIVKLLNVSSEKIVVTYEGIDNKINSTLSSNNESSWRVAALSLPKGMTPSRWMSITDRYFLHIGNLYPHKNMELVLAALKKIKDQDHISIPLVIAGKEDFFYHRFQKKVKELGITDQIMFLGEITDSELQYLYQSALALVSPSRMEGFDLPVVEAMANNCLVLASDIPAHREICKDAVIYFDSSDPDYLTLKLREIYKNGKDKYKEQIQKGKTLAEKFSWERMAKETLKVYEDSISI